MRTKDMLIEPEDLPPGEGEAVQIFSDAGWSGEDARWLASYCLSLLPRADDDGPGLDLQTEHNLRTLAETGRESGASGFRDRALLMIYTRLCGCGGEGGQLFAAEDVEDGISVGGPPWSLPKSEWAGVAQRLREEGANFENAFVSAGWPGKFPDASGLSAQFVASARYPSRSPAIVRLMHALRAAGLELEALVDETSVVASGMERMQDGSRRRTPGMVAWGAVGEFAPRSLTLWMLGLGSDVAAEYLPVILTRGTGRHASLLWGVRHSVEQWLFVTQGNYTYFREAGPQLGDALYPLVERLEEMCADESRDDYRDLRRLWLWFSLAAFQAKPSLLGTARREHLLRAATEDLAKMRALLARAIPKHEPGTDPLMIYPPPNGHPLHSWEEFLWEEDHFHICTRLLWEIGDLWRGMKPLLLCLRALAAPSVCKDLRSWSDGHNEEPPQPWAVIPNSLLGLFQHHAAREQALDPDLVSLRGEMAAFFLERLRDRLSKSQRVERERAGGTRTNDDMVEPSPIWRMCLIRAAVSLGINPEGKGHRVLHAASRIDPDPDVRDSARQGYEQIRRQGGKPEAASPRRAVITAMWWVRQAHLLGLGVQPDRDRAQRTREKELRRTMELEREPAPRE